MICKVCKGTGKQHVRGRMLTPNGWVEEPPVDIDCIWCKGTGNMTEQQAQDLEDYRNAWCRCKNSSGSHPYRHANGAHGWKCNDCGKITQTG